MNRFLFSLLVGCAGAFAATAQPAAPTATGPLTLSLAQARDLGLQNRFDAQANRYEVAVAESAVKRSKQEWLPNVSASGLIRYNTQLQSTLIPAGFVDNEAHLLALGAKNVTIFGLDLNQPIYNPAITTNSKLAQNELAVQQERNRGRDIQIKQQISQAYLNVLLRRLQQRIAGRDERRFQEYFRLADGRYQNGALIENDYLRAQLDYQNARVQAITSRQAYELSLVTLRYQLNVPATTPLILTDSLETQLDGLAPIVATGATAPQTATENRTELRQLSLEQEGNALRVLRLRQANRPTVSLFGNFSGQYLNSGFNYGLSEWWTPFSYVGIQLSVPLTGIVKNRENIAQARLRSLQTNTQLQQEAADVSYEVQRATTELNDALENLQQTRRNYDLAGTVYENQKQQLVLGAFRYDDLLNTELSLSNAEQNYVRIAYNYLVAKLSYEVATGAL